MSYYFGLYFGNTNLCLAAHRDGKTEVVANSHGDRVTPAYVSFTNGEKLVGLSAKQGMVRNANNTITYIKTLLGGDRNEIEKVIGISKCKIVENDNFQYEVTVDDKVKHCSPYEALVLLFKNMAIMAKSTCHEVDIPVVVGVPFRLKQKEKEVVGLAAMEAGFRLLRIISEPSAAALAYDIGQDSVQTSSYCVVFRMGGTSLDVSVIKVVNGIYQVIAYVKDTECGGNLFTRQIADFCSSEFKRQYRADISGNVRSVIKLHTASETCKHVLSSMGSAQCFVESVHEGIDLSINVSRARFESLVSPLLPNCLKTVNEVLAKANVTTNDISEVVLAGGSCKMPKLQQILAEAFPLSNLRMSISPDEVIAIGAAKQGDIVESETVKDKDCYINVLTNAIYMKYQYKGSDKCLPLFSKHAHIPASCFHEIEIENHPTTVLEIFEDPTDSGDITNGKILAKLCIPCESEEKYSLTCDVQEETFQLRFTDSSGNTKEVDIPYGS